jgi:hypothetical protein
MDQDEKVRENRLRRVAERRGWELSKSRRRDPLALDFGQWTLTGGSISAGGVTMPMRTVTLSSLDKVEAFLDSQLIAPVTEEGER